MGDGERQRHPDKGIRDRKPDSVAWKLGLKICATLVGDHPLFWTIAIAITFTFVYIVNEQKLQEGKEFETAGTKGTVGFVCVQ